LIEVCGGQYAAALGNAEDAFAGAAGSSGHKMIDYALCFSVSIVKLCSVVVPDVTWLL
jgi:hypothetical protein